MNVYNELKTNNFQFNTLIQHLKSLSNNDEYLLYLNKWLSILNNLEQLSSKEFDIFINALLTTDSKPEFYQYVQPFNILNMNYNYNFNIDSILQKTITSKYKYNTTKLLCKKVDYDKTIILEDNKSIKKSPIILCPFILEKYSYIVIDGNTRLNYNIKNHKLLTKYLIYVPYYKNDFIFSIDWAMYHFINEINKINFYLSQRNINDFLEESILNYDIFNSQLIF